MVDMRVTYFVISVFILMFSQFAPASNWVSSKGTITTLRVPSYDSNNIYFKLSTTPNGVTQWFYLRSDDAKSNGCSTNGDINTLTRSYSMLLAAKAAAKEVTVNYCIDNNGYGLINYIEM